MGLKCDIRDCGSGNYSDRKEKMKKKEKPTTLFQVPKVFISFSFIN